MRRRVREGSSISPAPDTFLEMYDRCATRVLVFHTRRVFDPEIARDLWGETFAAAYEQWATRRGRSQAETEAWIFGIARHVLARYYRRGYAEARALNRLGLERPELPADEREQLADLAGQAAARARLADAMGGLSDRERSAVALRFLENLPYEEIAARLGISEQTARTRVSRGLRNLRRTMEEDA